MPSGGSGKIDELEQAAVTSLVGEFSENWQRLVQTKAEHDERRADVLHMLRVIADRGEPPGSYEVSDSVLARIGGYVLFEPARGALSSLLNSGGLLLIRDDSLKMALSAFPDALADLTASEEVVLGINENSIVPILHEFIPYVSIDHRAGEPGFDHESPFIADYRGLLGSLAFENWLDLHVLRLNRLLADFDNTIEEADFILDRLAKAQEP